MKRTFSAGLRWGLCLTCVGWLAPWSAAQVPNAPVRDPQGRVAPAPLTLSPQEAAAVDQAVRAEMAKQQAVGVAVGVIRDGQIVYLNGYGWADAARQIPVSPTTMFRWASMSKTLTAVAALQLAEDGKLDLDADVRQYVPEFPDKGVKITTRQLLCHQSGIPHYSNGQIIPTKRQYQDPHPFADVVTALDKFNQSPLLFEPGTKFSYSTYAYILLSAVVQRAGGQPFADQVRQRIVEPLGMMTLQPDYQWLPIPGRAEGYVMENGAVALTSDTDVSWKLGGGGYISNVEDMARWAQGLIQGKMLQQETAALAWQPQPTRDGVPTNWGLGFDVKDAGTRNWKVAHDGKQEKATCRMVLYPLQKRGVVVMTNSEYAEPSAISTAIFAALQGAR